VIRLISTNLADLAKSGHPPKHPSHMVCLRTFALRLCDGESFIRSLQMSDAFCKSSFLPQCKLVQYGFLVPDK